jgi:dTDP-4-dehydrorhamnose reductase
MLGQMVCSYFNSKGFEIFKYDKRFDEFTIHQYVENLNKYESGIIINCIGRIKQKSESPFDLFLSNSLLPLELSRNLKSDHLLIHPSTDCVFDGIKKDPYLIFDKHTANDIYGISKSLGETALMSRLNTLIVRVSIIGPDKNTNKGLLSWFLNYPTGSVLNGYTNHFWNGITTLEWCEKLYWLLNNHDLMNELIKKKIVQLGSEEIYSKYEMLKIFNRIFNREFTIVPYETESIVNRCLVAEIKSVPLELQIENLNTFMVKYNLY